MQVRRWAQCLPQVTLTLLYHHSSNSPVRVPFPWKLNTNHNLTLLVSHQPTNYYASTSVSEFDFRLPVLCFIPSAAYQVFLIHGRKPSFAHIFDLVIPLALTLTKSYNHSSNFPSRNAPVLNLNTSASDTNLQILQLFYSPSLNLPFDLVGIPSP